MWRFICLPANYDFSYDVQDNAVSLDFGHNEKRKEDHASGSYHVFLPDGRTQLVEYEAGPDGYKPQVMYIGTATFPAAGAGDKSEGYHSTPRPPARACGAPPRAPPHPPRPPRSPTQPVPPATLLNDTLLPR